MAVKRGGSKAKPSKKAKRKPVRKAAKRPAARAAGGGGQPPHQQRMAKLRQELGHAKYHELVGRANGLLAQGVEPATVVQTLAPEFGGGTVDLSAVTYISSQQPA